MEAQLYEELRPRLFAIAYRMLGSVAEAEDVVQDAFVRYHGAGAEVESPQAYLTAVVTRLAIDRLRSARARREQYVGPWLPEPLLTDRADSESAETADSLSLAFLLVLERLSPVERAVFLLRDVFDFDYDEIAPIVRKSEDNCRQLAVRARRRVEAGKPRFESSRDRRDELARRFLAAWRDGETEALVELLAEDVVVYADGGGKARAAPRPVAGREQVARFLLGLRRHGMRQGLRLEAVEVNGHPGAVVLDAEDVVTGVVGLDIADGCVHALRNVVNPDKLRHLSPAALPGPRATG